MRNKFTDEEWNALSKLTRNTHLDEVFDVWSDGKEDFIMDFEEGEKLSIKDGLDLLYDSLAYPLEHDGMSPAESQTIANLFKEFEVEANTEWLLEKEGDT